MSYNTKETVSGMKEYLLKDRISQDLTASEKYLCLTLISINQSNTFARAPVTDDDHWHRTSNLIKLVS